MDRLRKNLSTFTTLQAFERERLLSHMKTVVLAKGETLLMQNMICDIVAFVEHGCLRAVRREADGAEITLSFATEGSWVTSSASLTDNEPPAYAIEAVESSRLFCIDRDVLFNMASTSLNVEHFLRSIFPQKLIELERRIIGLLQDTASNRYKKLETEEPDLVNRLPKNFVATYLGIRSGSLSRILKGFKDEKSQNETLLSNP